MVLNRIWHCLTFLGLTLGSLTAIAQEPVRHSISMPPDFNDERYRSPGIAYVERLWALPDCQLQTAAESGQLFWACVISNPHPSPHDGWIWIGEISPDGQLLHSGYLSDGDEDSQSLGKGKILAISQNILILAEDKAVLAYKLSSDTQTQPLKPIWRIEAGFQIEGASISSNQQILIWGYEKQGDQIEKVLMKIFDLKGEEIATKTEIRSSEPIEILDRHLFLDANGIIQVLGEERHSNFNGHMIPDDMLFTYRKFFACISPDEKKEIEFEEYFELPNQAVQVGFQYENFAYAFFIINTENVKNSLQIYRFPRCGEFSNKVAFTIFEVALPPNLIDAQIKQVKILPDETVLLAYTSSVNINVGQNQLIVSRLDLQQQKILWSKVVMPVTPTNDQYLRLHEDKGKVQIAIAYDEKTKQIGVAVFNNSINPNNWDDFPRPLDDQEFFPRIYTFRLDQ